MLLVVENAHLLDDEGSQLLDTIATTMSSRVLVVKVQRLNATRSRGGPGAADRSGTAVEAEVLQLDNLTLEELGVMLAGRFTSSPALFLRSGLHSTSVAPHIVEVIHSRAQGHPFVAIEFFTALIQNHAVLLDPATDTWVFSAVKESIPKALRIPYSLEQAVRSETACLDSVQLLILKVASVLGLFFSKALLTAVFPAVVAVELSEEGFRRAVRSLCELGFFVPCDAAGVTAAMERVNVHSMIRAAKRTAAVQYVPPSYDSLRFGRLVVMDVTYNSLPFSQRVQLHRVVADELTEVLAAAADAHADASAALGLAGGVESAAVRRLRGLLVYHHTMALSETDAVKYALEMSDEDEAVSGGREAARAGSRGP
jgi:hypothetical protein